MLWLEKDDHTDDITIIVGFLHHGASPTSPTSPTSPQGIASSMAASMAYTSATGDWFSTELLKAAMGLTRPQRATRPKGKRPAASLEQALSVKMGDDYEKSLGAAMAGARQTNPSLAAFPAHLAGAGVPDALVPRVLDSVRANILFAELADETVRRLLGVMERF